MFGGVKTWMFEGPKEIGSLWVLSTSKSKFGAGLQEPPAASLPGSTLGGRVLEYRCGARLLRRLGHEWRAAMGGIWLLGFCVALIELLYDMNV